MPEPDLALPPAVAHAFVEAMHTYFAEQNEATRGQIAVVQLRTLQEHYRRKLRLHDVIAMFHEMRDHLDGPSRQSRKRLL
jgi:hypothetical protein